MIQHVWVFAGLYVLQPQQTETWLSRIRELRVTDVVLVLNLNSWRSLAIGTGRLGAQRVTKVAASMIKLGGEVHLMTWLRPSERFISDCARALLPLSEQIGVTSILFDVEREWRTTRVDHESVVRSFFESHFHAASCFLGVTSIAAMPAAVIPLAKRCHYVSPQGYSQPYTPGATERRAHTKWRTVALYLETSGVSLPPSAMVMGLPAWNPARSGPLSQHDMETALSAVEALRNPPVAEVAYWQLNLLHGGSRAFVQGLARRARGEQAPPSMETDYAWTIPTPSARSWQA